MGIAEPGTRAWRMLLHSLGFFEGPAVDVEEE